MKNAKKRSWANKLVLVVLIAVAGCASIMSGTRQEVKIKSSPSAATVKIERPMKGEAMEAVWEGTTPASVKLKRKHAYLVTVSLDGYRPVELGLEKGTNGWVWGNLVFGGILGAVIDFSNGAASKLKPDEINVELVSVTAAGPHEESSVYAVLQGLDEEGRLRSLSVPLVPEAR